MEKVDIIAILSVLGSILTFIIAYFNKGQKECSELSKKYFENIVVIYINKYKKNKNINAVKFVKGKLKEEEYFIPGYILALIDKNDKEKLKKVIIQDYNEKFPNNKNSFVRTFDDINNIVNLIGVTLYFVISIPVIFSILLAVKRIVETIYYRINGITGIMSIGNIKFSNIGWDIVGLIIPIIFLMVSLIGVRCILNSTKDEYTLNKKKIEKIIKEKVKCYDKNHEKYYI